MEDIKRALISTNSSLPLVTELFSEEYYVPCDIVALGYNETNDCMEKLYLCPPDMQNSEFTRTCALLDLITTIEAEFISRRTRIGSTMGAHAMLLVGWSDEYLMPGQSRGGFIVQNSWSEAISHTSRYFTYEMSRRNDEYLCPNAQNAREWVPIDNEGEDKWKLRSTTVLKYTGGVKPFHFHFTYMDTLRAAMNTAGLSTEKFYAIKEIKQSIDRTHRVVMGVADT